VLNRASVAEEMRVQHQVNALWCVAPLAMQAARGVDREGSGHDFTILSVGSRFVRQ